jgi:flagellar hook-associated protein 3 FlgL
MTWSVGSLSTFQFNLFNRQNVQRSTEALQKAGYEVSTGKKSDIYLDLGPGAASLLRLRAREGDTQTYLQSNDVLASKLEAMLTSVNAIRQTAQPVLESALINASRPQTGAEVLQREARAALESMTATMNTSFNGEHLFSGLASDAPPLSRWEQANAATGLSPQDVLAAIVGTGPADAAEATAMIEEIERVFASQSVVDPDRNFEATFYNGAPALDGTGTEIDRFSARVNVGQEVEYGVQANDAAFREIYKGFAMLAAVDVSKLEQDAYEVWMAKVIEVMSDGQEGALDASARIGFNQQIVEDTQVQLTDLSLIQRTQISEYESVDSYEAITRMTNLQNQLEASYQVSARLSGLTILNYLR